MKEGYHCIYGEVTDEEIMERMNLSKIKLLISTVPEIKDNITLINKTREVNRRAKIIVTAQSIEQALKLYEKGADYVIMPHFLGGEHVSKLITKMRKHKVKIKDEKKRHIRHLEDRKEMGHNHPHPQH